MTNYLAAFALVLAAGSYVLGRRDAAGSRPSIFACVLLVILLAAGAKFSSKYGVAAELIPTIVGLGIGMMIALASEWLGVAAAAVGIGAAAGTVGFYFHNGSGAVQLAIMVGGMAATIVSPGGRIGALAVFTASAVAVMNAIGKLAVHEPAAVSLGSVAGLFIAAAALAAVASGKRIWAIPLAVLIAVGGFSLTVNRLLPDHGLMVPALLGVATGLVIVLLIVEGEADALRTGVAVILWLGLGVFALATAKGLGMSIALLGGLSVPLALARARPLLTAGPLFTLVLYRLWSARAGATNDAVDTRDLYAFVGLVFGAMLPILIEEWRNRAEVASIRAAGTWGGFVWVVLMLGLPITLLQVVGSDASDGFVVGLGFGVLAMFNRREVNVRPLALAAGLSAAVMFTAKWTAKSPDLTRAERTHFIAYAVGAILILSLPLALLVRTKPAKEPQ